MFMEAHPSGCECAEEHVDGRVRSERLAVLNLDGAQVCVFSGDRMQTAYVRVLEGARCVRVLHVPEGTHAPVAASWEQRITWVRLVVPRLLAALRADRIRSPDALAPAG